MRDNSGAVAGTGNRRALGTDPDLERLARVLRKAGGRVEVNRRTHLLWFMPDGTVLRSGLTMSRNRVRIHVREVRRALGLE